MLISEGPLQPLHVIAHIVLWPLSLELSTEHIVDSRPHPPSLGMRGEGEVVWLHTAEAYTDVLLDRRE